MSGSVCSESGAKVILKLRPPASKYWCFTYNNYKEDELSVLSDLFNKYGEYIYGEEIAPYLLK